MNRAPILNLIFIALLLLCACTSLTTKKPATLLPIDSVAAIVADSFFLESEIYVKQSHYDLKEYSLTKYETFFMKHGITKEVYVENVKYYFTNDKYSKELMAKVDEIVEARVAALRDSLNLKP